jgi:nucleoside-diphosphate kinase
MIGQTPSGVETGQMASVVERTLLLIKPDGVSRGLVGEILARVERTGLAIIGLRMTHVSQEFAAGHYATTDAQLAQMGNKTLTAFEERGLDVAYEFGTEDPVELGRMIHRWNCEFLASGPVVAAVIQGYHAVRKLRNLCGSTMPRDAAPGTIRGDYSSVSSLVASTAKTAVRNLIHASDDALDPDEPAREIEYWFKSGELWQVDLVSGRALT